MKSCTELVVEVAKQWKKKHPCHTKLCVFRCLISVPQNLTLRSQKSNSNILVENYFFLENNVTSREPILKLFILSTALHCLLPCKLVLPKVSTAFKHDFNVIKKPALYRVACGKLECNTGCELRKLKVLGYKAD